jgi:hypothetical protein
MRLTDLPEKNWIILEEELNRKLYKLKFRLIKMLMQEDRLKMK